MITAGMPDAVLVSYPKSGRTWLRYMLSHYLNATGHVALEAPLDLSSMFRVVPNTGSDAEKGIPAAWATARPQPAIAASHDASWLDRDRPAVLLLRDPAEVMVSHLHHELRHLGGRRFDGDLTAFLDADVGFGRMAMFLAEAAQHVDRAHVRVTTYDELLADPFTVTRATLVWLGVTVPDEAAVHAAVAAGEFSAMARLEEGRSVAGATYDYEDVEARRIRAGVADRGATLFDDEGRRDLADRLRARVGETGLSRLRRFAPDDWTL